MASTSYINNSTIISMDEPCSILNLSHKEKRAPDNETYYNSDENLDLSSRRIKSIEEVNLKLSSNLQIRGLNLSGNEIVDIR